MLTRERKLARGQRVARGGRRAPLRTPLSRSRGSASGLLDSGDRRFVVGVLMGSAGGLLLLFLLLGVLLSSGINPEPIPLSGNPQVVASEPAIPCVAPVESVAVVPEAE